MDTKISSNKQLRAAIGTWEVLVAGVAPVVASSTLVSEFTGYFNLGAAFFMALLLGFVINQIPALLSSQVIDWIYSAAYAWIILYGVFHVLSICNRILRPEKSRAFKGRWFLPAAALGAVTTGISLYYAFAGSHLHYGPRALIVLLVALVATGVSFHFSALAPRTARKVITREVAAMNRNVLRGINQW